MDEDKLTILNGGAFLHGGWSNDVSHELGKPLRIKEVDVLQSVVLKVEQSTCS